MPGTYLSVVLRRSLGFWIGLRLLLVAVVLVFAPSIAAVSKTPVASLIMVALTAGLVLFDASAVGEDLLLANFGVSPFRVAVRACVIPTIAELIVLGTLALMVRT